MSNGYGRTATYVVSASNATSKSAGASDYQCNGSNDAAMIQDAIHAMTAETNGGPGFGRVILTEGEYFLSQPIYIDVSNITLEGQGQSTYIAPLASATSPIGGASIIIGSNGAFDGITYTGMDSAPMSAPEGVIVRGMAFYDYTGGMTGYPRTDTQGGGTTTVTVTAGSTSVTDTSAVTTPGTGDLGMSITGPGIQPGTYITSVTAGSGYTISNPATGSYSGSGTSVIVGLSAPGSASGIINRGNGTHISDVNVQTPLWDGLSYQGFRQMNTTPYIGVGPAWTGSYGTITSTPSPTSATFTVTMTSPPTGTNYVPFLALIEPSSSTYDYDPEIVLVTSVTLISGSSYTFGVQRGYLNTVARAHAANATLNVMTVEATSNGVTRDCYLYSPLRSGILTQSGGPASAGVEDSEWYACLIQGGTAGSPYTGNGILTGAGGLRFIDCHPYYCSNAGLLAQSGTPMVGGGYYQYPPLDIIAGEYETNGGAGIEAVGCGGVTITGGVSFYANTGNDIVLTNSADFRISGNWMTSACSGPHISLSGTDQGTVHDNVLSGDLGTVDLIEITGSGPGTNLEMIVHDNVIQASGGTGPSIALVNAAGVNVHDNTCETSIVESGTSDFNVIHNNTLVNLIAANPPITVTGSHTRSYGNIGTADYAYINSSVTLPAADRNYWLDSSGSALTILPPGANFGGTACTGGDSAGSTTVHMSAYPSSWPQSGFAYIPVSGGTTGYERVSYQYIDSSGNLQGCTGVTSATVSGTAYLCPDPSMRFQFFLLSSLHSVTFDVPAGMTVNGLTTAFMTSTTNHLYNAWLNATAGDWFIF
jgi:hypothetical protein